MAKISSTRNNAGNYVLFDQKIFISLNIVISLIELIIIGILYIREKKKGGSKI